MNRVPLPTLVTTGRAHPGGDAGVTPVTCGDTVSTTTRPVTVASPVFVTTIE